MYKKLLPIAIFNILVSLVFIGSNLYLWNFLNGKISYNNWGPLQMGIVPKTIVSGEVTTIGLYSPIPNYPFILFWVAIIGNFVLAFLAIRSANKKQPSG